MLLNIILITIIILLIIIIYLIVRWSYRIIGTINKTFQKTTKYTLKEIKQLEDNLRYSESRNIEIIKQKRKIDSIVTNAYKNGLFNNTECLNDLEDWLRIYSEDYETRIKLRDGQKFLSDIQGGFND